MFKRIEIKNFKSLKNVNIWLKPLTIFIGPNGAGKSSVIQVIALLKKFFLHEGSISLENLFNLEDYINMGSWRDVVFEERKPIEASIDLEKDGVYYNYSVQIHKNAEVKLSFNLTGRVRGNDSLIFKIPYYEKDKQEKTVTFSIANQRAYMIWNGFKMKPRPQFREIPKDVAEVFNNWWRSMYILPLHVSIFKEPYTYVSTDDTSYLLSEIKRKIIVPYNLLISLIVSDPNIEDHVTYVFNTIFNRHVRGHVYPGNKASIIVRSIVGKTVNIINEGGGINRLAFLAGAIGMAEKDSLLLIEEPETNLHPSAQYKLAKMFINAVNEGKNFIITTHSEHFLFGILNSIARREISSNLLNIYYFSKSRGETKVRLLNIDEKGRVKGGLPGFFEEEIEELLSLISR